MAHGAPSPEKAPPKRRQKAEGATSQRDLAALLGLPKSNMGRNLPKAIKKRAQLTAGEKGIYWSRALKRNGYSKITPALRELLMSAFNNHPHVIVSPNTKDTLQVKNAEGVKEEVRKVLHQVGLGDIFSDSIKDNPEIKGTVGERSFRYIVTSMRTSPRTSNPPTDPRPLNLSSSSACVQSAASRTRTSRCAAAPSAWARTRCIARCRRSEG